MTTGNKNPGNFANDREKASEAGKKGGQASGGNFANFNGARRSVNLRTWPRGMTPPVLNRRQ